MKRTSGVLVHGAESRSLAGAGELAWDIRSLPNKTTLEVTWDSAGKITSYRVHKIFFGRIPYDGEVGILRLDGSGVPFLQRADGSQLRFVPGRLRNLLASAIQPCNGSTHAWVAGTMQADGTMLYQSLGFINPARPPL
jgi:hypothetical protein